jgi:hypothetical protein
MNQIQDVGSARTPMHLWIVGIIALLWECMGAYDYLMTETRNAGYMARFSPEELAYFYSFPTWVISLWAIAVWGSLAGAIFLLLRKRVATPLFLIGLVAMVATTIHNYGFSNGMEVVGGTGSLIFTGVIFLTSLALYLYARAMQKKGVLK